MSSPAWPRQVQYFRRQRGLQLQQGAPHLQGVLPLPLSPDHTMGVSPVLHRNAAACCDSRVASVPALHTDLQLSVDRFRVYVCHWCHCRVAGYNASDDTSRYSPDNAGPVQGAGLVAFGGSCRGVTSEQPLLCVQVMQRELDSILRAAATTPLKFGSRTPAKGGAVSNDKGTPSRKKRTPLSIV